MLTFYQLLKLNDIEPKEVSLIRHSNKEIQVMDVFHQDPAHLVEYTAWQSEKKFKDSKYLAIFAPARGTRALFLGMWGINGIVLNRDLDKRHLDLIETYSLPENWATIAARYQLDHLDVMSDFVERLIIDWGKSTVSWVQKKDKPVVQIISHNSIGEFNSYDDIQLTRLELKKLFSDSDSNTTWVNALAAVNGVYLIRHKLDGKLYVGSAYGKGGILGRWQAYANTGHGGNKLLKPLDPDNFEFSVLEIASSIISAGELIDRETRWKVRLGTREFGLNDN